eukprot:Seg2418.3 transcript_id=Seg2418.3/GoldUCD/mRNA.D3Y31 product="RanBP-type and C3HC4-type zinc finger-containing protein 1" protein_id=Seg2418.3/GoldUCD/D3Y31
MERNKMAVEVIFNCNATVQQYNPATREFEYLKFRDVSTVTILCLTDQMNVQARPIYKMAVAAGRDHVPILDLTLGSNVVYQPTPHDPTWNVVRVVTPNGVETFGFKIIGGMEQAAKFSQYLSTLTGNANGAIGSLNPPGSTNSHSAVNPGNVYSENPSQFPINIGQQPLNYNAGNQFGTSPQNQMLYDRIQQGAQAQGQSVTQDQFRNLYDQLRMQQTTLPPQQIYLPVNQNYGPQTTPHLSGDYMSMHDPRETFRATQENPYESIPAFSRLNKTAPANIISTAQLPPQPKVKLNPRPPPMLPPRNPQKPENLKQISNQVNEAHQQIIVKEGKENNEDEIVANPLEKLKEAVDIKVENVPNDPVLPPKDDVADKANNPEVANSNEVKPAMEEKPMQLKKVAASPEGEPGRIATVDIICDMLAEAIDLGNEEKTAELATELAKKKAKLTIQVLYTEEEKKAIDDTINITVQVEDKHSDSPISIKLDVNPVYTTVGKLKYMVLERFEFPIKIQRWVIGKRLPKDNETLKQLDVQTTGTVIFLYLLSAKEAGVPPPIKQDQTVVDGAREHNFDLPPRDYEQGAFDLGGPPPLNPARHGYSTAPVGFGSGFGFQMQGLPVDPFAPVPNPDIRHFDNPPQHHPYVNIEARQDVRPRIAEPMPPVPERKPVPFPPPPSGNAAPHVRQRDRPLPPPPGRHQIELPPPPPPRIVQGWKCNRCTYVNTPTRPGCEMCGDDRPEDYQIPADVRIDEKERHRLEQEAILEQLAFNHEQKIKDEERRLAFINFENVVKAAENPLIPNAEAFECEICYAEYEKGEGVILRECIHVFCKDCLRQTIQNSEDPEVKCPHTDGNVNCMQVITAQEIAALLTEEEYVKFLDRSVNAAENRAANSFHCKTSNCGGWCIYEDEVNWYECQVCQKRNCLTCKAIHDNMTCKEYQDDLKRRAHQDEAAKKTQEMLDEMLRNGDAMNCPHCQVILQKKDGCDWMRCSMCRTEICWATKGRRWGPKGNGDTSGGCRCRAINGKPCHPKCGNCH